MNGNKLWFYYRYGYSFYIAPLLAALNTMMLVYFMVGDKAEIIRIVFPHFFWFALFAVVVGLPTLTLIGFLHYKKAYKNEVDVTAKNNPYHFKLMPGHQTEVNYPILLELVRYLKVLNPSDKERTKRLEELEKKIEFLIQGNNIKSFIKD